MRRQEPVLQGNTLPPSRARLLEHHPSTHLKTAKSLPSVSFEVLVNSRTNRKVRSYLEEGKTRWGEGENKGGHCVPTSVPTPEERVFSEGVPRFRELPTDRDDEKVLSNQARPGESRLAPGPRGGVPPGLGGNLATKAESLGLPRPGSELVTARADAAVLSLIPSSCSVILYGPQFVPGPPGPVTG